MRFYTRLLIAFMVVVLVPILVLGFGLRGQTTRRLSEQYQRRVAALTSVVEADLERRRVGIADRLATLVQNIVEDNDFRAAVRGARSAQRYLLDYAEREMRVAGLDVLQIQDRNGKIISSGHFRNEYDRLEPGLPEALAKLPQGSAVFEARIPEGQLLALVQVDSFRVMQDPFFVVGGVAIEQDFVSALAGDQELTVTVVYPDGAVSSDSTAVGAEAPEGSVVESRSLPYVSVGDDGVASVEEARFIVAHPLGPLDEMRRSIDRWLVTAALVTVVAAFLVASWLSLRLSRPIADLAKRTSQLDLDRLDVRFDQARRDEIGTLARVLNAMTDRMRKSSTKLREAERRATVGDIARQLNHDIKNGLTPIRNVFQHLSEVLRDRPADLAVVLKERQPTLDSGIEYLQTLASNYARLSPTLNRQPCDVNVVVQDVLQHLPAGTHVEIVPHLARHLPPVLCDAVVLRRIVENIVGNAVESLASAAGKVTIRTTANGSRDDTRNVCIEVSDTGPGMTRDQLDKAFNDFYTTKPGGTGLGLSIVRRLVLDLNGTLAVKSEPGVGTEFKVEIPVAT